MNTMKKIQVDNNWCKYISSRNDTDFSECSLAVEIDERGHTDRDLICEDKRQKALEKNLVINLLELVQLMQKMVMIQIMRLVMYKHLLMSSKTKKIGKQLIKEKGIREKLEKEMRNEKNN